MTRTLSTIPNIQYQVTCRSSQSKPTFGSIKLPEKAASGSSAPMRGMSSSVSSSNMMTSTRSQAGMKVSPALVKAYIALGSNMGDRLSMLEQSLDEMEARDIHVLRTSSLYETAPMYVTDQDVFLNGICEVR